MFNFREELTKYCKQDVTVLRLACLRYREEKIADDGMDPLRYSTIAQAAQAVFAANYLEKDTLAVHIEHGQRPSKAAMQWLFSLPEIDDIQHALSAQRRKVGMRATGGRVQFENKHSAPVSWLLLARVSVVLQRDNF